MSEAQAALERVSIVRRRLRTQAGECYFLSVSFRNPVSKRSRFRIRVQDALQELQIVSDAALWRHLATTFASTSKPTPHVFVANDEIELDADQIVSLPFR